MAVSYGRRPNKVNFQGPDYLWWYTTGSLRQKDMFQVKNIPGSMLDKFTSYHKVKHSTGYQMYYIKIPIDMATSPVCVSSTVLIQVLSSVRSKRSVLMRELNRVEPLLR